MPRLRLLLALLPMVPLPSALCTRWGSDLEVVSWLCIDCFGILSLCMSALMALPVLETRTTVYPAATAGMTTGPFHFSI